MSSVLISNILTLILYNIYSHRYKPNGYNAQQRATSKKQTAVAMPLHQHLFTGKR